MINGTTQVAGSMSGQMVVTATTEQAARKSPYFFLLAFILILLMDAMLGKFALSGGSSAFTVLGASFCLFLATRSTKAADSGILWVILPLLFLALLYIFLDDPTGRGRGQRNGFFLVTMAFMFYCGTRLRNLSAIPRFFDVVPILITAVFGWLVVANSETASGFAATKNAVSGLLVHIAFMWLLLKKTHKAQEESNRIELLTVVWLLAMSAIVSHRTFFAVLLICLLIIASGRFFPLKSKFLIILITVIALIVANYVLVYAMANINTSNFVGAINNISDDYFGRRFTSGRETLWYLILYALTDNMWMGLGPGILPSDFIDTNLSSHNSYLQVLLQMGIVGLVLVIIPLFFIALKIGKIESRSIFFVALIYYLATIIHGSLEVILTQNNFPISSIIWVNFGIVFSMSRNINNK